MTQTAPQTRFVVRVPGSEAAVREGLAEVMAHLAPLALSPDDSGTVELVLAEALNNIVEHALAQTCELHDIRVEGRRDPAGLHLLISDPGTPMPGGQAPAGAPPQIDLPTQTLPEGGFGWFMIQTLAQDVRYARIGAENRLSLRLPLSG
ncbi:ATP-binding protein [Sulfitobacter albidus]|uniref:ATP-binding protein n=1 Tax=Sulfitobacter albidus TaxID=2829501 RepID=A0A975JDI2_9RHOB|nr:ATP-binding protein [Sulfitobacter albidus]QUJ76484.1 ATP-binding protein [Sulfitobacter albidus]